MRGREGRGGISNRGCRLGNSPSTSFFFLCSEVAAGDQVIEVHCCCCPGGLLGGLAAGREGFWREFLRGAVGPVVVPFCLLALPSHRGRRRRSGDRGPSLLLSGWTPRWPRCGAGTVGRNFRERERESLWGWSFSIFFLCLPLHRGRRRRPRSTIAAVWVDS